MVHLLHRLYGVDAPVHLWAQGIWKEGEPTLPMQHGTLNIYLSDGRYLSDVPRACSAV